MHIPEITLTPEELIQAVEQWIAQRGIHLSVESVERHYSTNKWKVELKDPTPTADETNNPA